MKKLVRAGETLVKIMAERIGRAFSSLDRRLALCRPAPAIFAGQAAALGQPAGLIGLSGQWIRRCAGSITAPS